jgi:magnesium chelatase family protein
MARPRPAVQAQAGTQPDLRDIAQYQTRLSGPLLDRIDLHVEVPTVTAADLMLPPPAEGSQEAAQRVAAAREIQVARYTMLGLPGIPSNAAAPANVIEAVAQPDASGLTLVREASDRLHLSARGSHRILKLARTIADLDGAEKVGSVHLAEALTYRIDTTRQCAPRERSTANVLPWWREAGVLSATATGARRPWK